MPKNYHPAADHSPAIRRLLCISSSDREDESAGGGAGEPSEAAANASSTGAAGTQAPETSSSPAGSEGSSQSPESSGKQRSRTKILVIAAVIIAVAVGIYFGTRDLTFAPVTASAGSQAGKYPVAPDFSVTDLSGQNVKLSDFRGNVVLLDFWATWCGPCRMEIPGFVQLQDRYRDQGFRILGISMDDSIKPVPAFYQEFHMNYPVAMGNNRLAELYGGIFGLPTTFLIGRDGRIYDKVEGAVDVSRFEDEIKVLLAAKSGQEVSAFKADGPSNAIEIETPAELNSQVPGIDLSKLTPAEIAAYKQALTKQSCTCGCNYNLLDCRTKDRSCGVSKQMARDVLAKLEKSKI